eukprot:s1324_g5.t1
MASSLSTVCPMRAVRGIHGVRVHLAQGCYAAALRSFSVLTPINDAKFKALCDTPATPFLVHCGAAWSQRSKRVADALAEWNSGELKIYSLDLSTAPETIEKRHIKGIPTLLLMREKRVEARADGADLQDLERLKEAARAYVRLSSPEDAADALKTAEVMWDAKNVSAAQQLYRRALEGDLQDAAFRARLGLVKCAVQVLEKASASDKESQVKELQSALDELRKHHEEELLGGGEQVRVDGQQQTILLAHAELLLDAWTEDDRSVEEKNILKLWACGERKKALEEALKWYRTVAGNDIPGLVAAYCLPERRMLDRPHSIPVRSIYAQMPELATDSESLGPGAPRALLRRMLLAAMDKDFLEAQGPSLLSESLADLAFLLDRKEFIPFHTRKTRCRRGGAPHTGRGTGKRSGFSKRYWICWPNTLYPNTKKMGSPHCDKND